MSPSFPVLLGRDGVSEGRFAQVLLHEIDAIRKVWTMEFYVVNSLYVIFMFIFIFLFLRRASLEDGYLPPITFVVVQKRHHTRLFPADQILMDKSGNILPEVYFLLLIVQIYANLIT